MKKTESNTNGIIAILLRYGWPRYRSRLALHSKGPNGDFSFITCYCNQIALTICVTDYGVNMNHFRNILHPIFLSGLILLAACGRQTSAPLSKEKPADEKISNKEPLDETKDLIKAGVYPMKFNGSDAGDTCTFSIHKEWYVGGVKDAKSYRALVSTGFGHDGANLGNVTVAFDQTLVGTPSENKRLIWGDAKKQSVVLVLSKAAKEIVDPASVSSKWAHGNHFHNDTCTNLTRVP